MKMKQKGLPPWNDNEKKRKRKAVALPASYLHVSEAQLLHGTLGRGGGGIYQFPSHKRILGQISPSLP